MKEKKELKISLGTAICIFIIIALVIALVFMYICYNKQNKDVNCQNFTQNKIEKLNLDNINNNDSSKEKITNNLKGTTWVSKKAYSNKKEVALSDVLGSSINLIDKSYLTLNDDGTFLNYIEPVTEGDRYRNGNWKLKEWSSEEGRLIYTIILEYTDVSTENSYKSIYVDYSENCEVKKLEYNANEYGIYDDYKIILEKEQVSNKTKQSKETINNETVNQKENTYFIIENIVQKNSKFEVTAYILEENIKTFTKEEYNNIKNGEKFTFRNVEWSFEKSVTMSEPAIIIVKSGDYRLSMVADSNENVYVLENVAGAKTDGLHDCKKKTVVFEAENIDEEILNTYKTTKDAYAECEAIIKNGKTDNISFRIPSMYR